MYYLLTYKIVIVTKNIPNLTFFIRALQERDFSEFLNTPLSHNQHRIINIANDRSYMKIETSHDVNIKNDKMSLKIKIF